MGTLARHLSYSMDCLDVNNLTVFFPLFSLSVDDFDDELFAAHSSGNLEVITFFEPPGSFHNSRGGKVLLTDFRAVDFLEPFMHGLVGWLVKWAKLNSARARHWKIASFCLAESRGSYDKNCTEFWS